MTKLPRIEQKIFGNTAVEGNAIAQFGSVIAGEPLFTGDIQQIQALDYWEKGWVGATITDRRFPTSEETTGINKVITQQIAYILQEGLPEYDINTTYYKGSWCKGVDEDNIRAIYESLIDDNKGNLLTDGAKWQKVELGGSGAGGFNLFDPVIKDHVLSFEESKGLALQGTYVYKTGVAGSRYGYPDFVAKCIEEYNNYNQLASIKDNVTLVGSVSLNNGVLSRFSSTSWAVLPQNFSPNTSGWKMFFKFTTGTIGTKQDIINTSSAAYQSLSISISSGGILGVVSYIDNTESERFRITGTTVLSTNATYYLSLEYNPSNGYTLKLGTNKDNMTTEGTSTVTSAINSGNNLALGADFGADGTYYEGAFTGSIDLKECYINIANSLWWKGSILLYQNSNGHKFYDIADKAAIDAWYDTYGVAWFYGVDEENERIFLPRGAQYLGYNKNTTLPVKVYGTGKTLGLTNGAANVGLGGISVDGPPITLGTGGYNVAVHSGGQVSGRSSSGVYGVVTDPSTSGLTGSVDMSIKGLEAYVYIVVGNTEQQSAITDVVDITSSENDTIPLGYSTYQGDGAQPSTAWLASNGQWNSGSVYTTFYNEYVSKIGQKFAGGYIREPETQLYAYARADKSYAVLFDTPEVVKGQVVYGYSPLQICGYVTSVNAGEVTIRDIIGNIDVIVYRDSQFDSSASIYNDYDLVINQDDMTFRLPLLDGSEDLPSSKYENLTLKANGSFYIASANGWFVLNKSANAVGQFANIYSLRTGIATSEYPATADALCLLSLYCLKDEAVQISHSLGGNTNSFSFVHAKGNGTLYFKVGNAVQNLELLDAGAITDALVNKVDITNTQWVASACMPDYTTGVKITSGWIAPYDSYGYCSTVRKDDVVTQVFINSIEVFVYSTGGYPKIVSGNFLIPKGSTVTFKGYFTTSPIVYKLKGAI